MKLLFMVLFFVGILVVFPYFTISSLNVLFGLEIPFNLSTWAATIWLGIAIHGNTVKATVEK